MYKGHSVARTVKTTIPIDIVERLGIEVGDTLEWHVLTDNGKKGAFMRKLE